MHNEVQVILSAIRAGASGYICKDCSPKLLHEAIKKVMATGQYLDQEIAVQLAYAANSAGTEEMDIALSDREMEIFRLVVEGNGIGEIAKQLFISDKTVSTHKSRLLKKLGLKNTVELVRYSIQKKLFV